LVRKKRGERIHALNKMCAIKIKRKIGGGKELYGSVQIYMPLTHKLCIGRKAALGLRHMPGLMAPSLSCAKSRAGSVMSPIRARHNLWNKPRG
jgi:hypothetical protein